MSVDPPNRSGQVFTKSEEHVQTALSRNHIAVTGAFKPPDRRYHVVWTVDDIEYKPGIAIEYQHNMIESLEDMFKLVEIPKTLRSAALQSEAQKVKELTAVPLKKTIAILGTTGVGKSSLINALVGDCIVPSSSLSACTSVPTEIAYHENEGIAADIIFIPREDWVKFISLVLDDHAGRNDGDSDEDEEGIQENFDSDGPVEVAWQKFRTVYPSITLQELSEMTAEDVIAVNPAFWKMLGTVKRIVSADPDVFRDEITQYIGSRSYESNTESEDMDTDTCGIPPQIWPLVAKVIIFHDADILAEGVSFVDLPGVADTNSARDNAAKDYMKNATHFWILTLSNRAISDKTAHELLGDALKTQLQLDGNLNAQSISLITTKNDQLTVSEVVRQLKLSKDPDFIELQDQIKLASELRDLEEQEQDCSAHIEAFRRGEDYVPKFLPGGKKGTRQSGNTAGPPNSRKSARLVGSAASSRGSRNAKGRNGDSGDGDAATRFSLNDLERKHATLSKSIEEIRARLRGTSCPETLHRQKKALCADRRSEHARKKLKASFQNMFEGTGLQDQTEINIPVFACSSADYLKLTGCSTDDGAAECFIDVAQTGIPRLLQYVREISKSTRHEQAIGGFSQVSAFARSVSGFAQVAQDISPADRAILRTRWETTEDRELPIRWNYYAMDEDNVGISRRLKREFSDAARQLLPDLQEHCREALEDKCRAGAQQASHFAAESLMKFVDSLKHWKTYGAVLRRDGHWEKRNLNLNYILTEPIKSAISQSWAVLFQSLPFGNLEERILQLLSQLFKEFCESAPDGVKAQAKIHSDICLGVMKDLLPRAFVEPRNLLVQAQKTISRGLDTHVSNQLHDVYAEAGAMTGKGMYRRQKNRLQEHLKKHGRAIFNSAIEALLTDVDNALILAVNSFGKSLDEFAVKVEMDLSVLWEVFNKDAPQVRARQYLATLATEIQGQAHLWMEAARLMEIAQKEVMKFY